MEGMKFKPIAALAAALVTGVFALTAGASPPRAVPIQELTLVAEDAEKLPGMELAQYHHYHHHHHGHHHYHHGHHHHHHYHHGHHHYHHGHHHHHHHYHW